MIGMFRKTEFMEYDQYKRIIDKLDDVYFMNYLAKRQMKNTV